jgi:hypothetical protein
MATFYFCREKEDFKKIQQKVFMNLGFFCVFGFLVFWSFRICGFYLQRERAITEKRMNIGIQDLNHVSSSKVKNDLVIDHHEFLKQRTASENAREIVICNKIFPIIENYEGAATERNFSRSANWIGRD